MMKKRIAGQESGLTLVEILASLVILGIVFIAFMTIFPQMTLFNARTETKLETMNEARIVLEEYKKNPVSVSQLKKASCPSEEKQVLKDAGQQIDGYTTIVEINICPDVTPENKDLYGGIQLHRIHIKIKEKSQLISETFGYVKVE